MILEGVVTTLNEDGTVNVAPMGPLVVGDELVFRPFASSTTYQNLRRLPSGVFHVTDDVLLIATAAVGRATVELEAIEGFPVSRLADCCRWRAFEIDEARWDERATLRTKTVATGRVRDFFGFNRAKHAVLEATILATRKHMIERAEIERQLVALRPLVEKTASPREVAAFQLIEEYVSAD